MRANPLGFLESELNSLRLRGLFRPLRVLDAEQQAHASIDHASVVNLSSNNYLGLTTHPVLRERALEAIRRFGVGSGSVRTIAGTMRIHLELERRLAAFKRTEAAVVFQSGFTANAGTVASLLGREDFIVSDELNHASIIDGARLSRATIKVFPHRDALAARQIVRDLPGTGRVLIISDGVFSMDGDLGVLPALCDVADEYGVRENIRFNTEVLSATFSDETRSWSLRLRKPDGSEETLTASEYDLLKVFAENPNRPLTRDWLLEVTAHREMEAFDRAIDLRITRLRRKIEVDPSHPDSIRTVRGVGYMFVPPKD